MSVTTLDTLFPNRPYDFFTDLERQELIHSLAPNSMASANTAAESHTMVSPLAPFPVNPNTNPTAQTDKANVVTLAAPAWLQWLPWFSPPTNDAQASVVEVKDTPRPKCLPKRLNPGMAKKPPVDTTLFSPHAHQQSSPVGHPAHGEVDTRPAPAPLVTPEAVNNLLADARLEDIIQDQASRLLERNRFLSNSINHLAESYFQRQRAE